MRTPFPVALSSVFFGFLLPEGASLDRMESGVHGLAQEMAPGECGGNEVDLTAVVGAQAWRNNSGGISF